eukprot:m.10686 g.10686  ORF g.10686 m.10686 type:complete len:109 (+) comp5604_c0_seq1:156-482(+)
MMYTESSKQQANAYIEVLRNNLEAAPSPSLRELKSAMAKAWPICPRQFGFTQASNCLDNLHAWPTRRLCSFEPLHAKRTTLQHPHPHPVRHNVHLPTTTAADVSILKS